MASKKARPTRSDGSFFTRRYGEGTGMEVRAECGIGADGQPVLRFPFTIPGI